MHRNFCSGVYFLDSVKESQFPFPCGAREALPKEECGEWMHGPFHIGDGQKVHHL